MAQISLAPLPPKEAIEYFRSKGFAPREGRFDWRDTWREEHARAFVVAKAMQDDVLRDIREALQTAMEEGQTLAQFREGLTPKLQARGWWGKSLMEDPLTGEMREVQLGSRHRLRVIFDTNMRTANAAGRWARIQRTKRAFPYLEYRQIQRPSKRDTHEPYHGLIRPVDDPVWARIMPPNGFFCGCTVRQLNDRMLKAEGKQVSPPFDFAFEDYENRRTGEIERVPKGIHPGFDTNPGAIWLDLSAQHADTRLSLPDDYAALDRGWVEEIRARGLRDGNESLMVYDLDAADPMRAEIGMNRSEPGKAHQVGITEQMSRVFQDPGRRSVAIHSHPNSGSFSGADMAILLTSPGLSQLVAIGVDGSLFRAERAGPARAVSIEAMNGLMEEVMHVLMPYVVAGQLDVVAASHLAPHIFMVVLSRMGLVRYAYAMSGIGEARLTQYAPLIDLVLEELS